MTSLWVNPTKTKHKSCLHCLNLETHLPSTSSFMSVWYNYNHSAKASTIIGNSSGMLMQPLKTVRFTWNYHPLQRLPVSPQSSIRKTHNALWKWQAASVDCHGNIAHPPTPLQLSEQLSWWENFNVPARSPAQHLCQDNLYSINYSATITFASEVPACPSTYRELQEKQPEGDHLHLARKHWAWIRRSELGCYWQKRHCELVWCWHEWWPRATVKRSTLTGRSSVRFCSTGQ